MTDFSPVRLAVILLVLAATAAAPACRRNVDLVAALEPLDIVTGWFDDGIVEGGKNRLVPSITLNLRNKGNDPLTSIQVNAIFRRVGETQMWGEHFGWAVQGEPLAAGAVSEPLVLRSSLGYTGVEPRAQMLQNSDFVDARVEVFVRRGSQPWARIAEYQIDRVLLTE